MAKKDIVVVGASAGGMEALQKLVAGLPPDFPASLFIVWHLAPGTRSVLPEVLGRAAPMPVVTPEDGDPIAPRRIYVAPNDHHMLLERGYIRIAKGPKENRFRPALDPLFRSAAYLYGPRAVGVVLSGALDDGTAGLWTIKLRGGTAIVQEPAEARIRSMPLSALDSVEVDYKLPAAEIGPLLGRLAREPAGPTPVVPQRERELLESEIRIAEAHDAMESNVLDFGQFSPFTCPECHGVLTMLRNGKLVRYRCHTGHAFSPNALLSMTTEDIEKRLWDALRGIDETVMLLNDMGEDFARSGNTEAAEVCFTKARDFYQRSARVREAATSTEELPAEDLHIAQG
jgi:two-component system, chemotaxis family, protein-glutamate methylesterase/glutaminase